MALLCRLLGHTALDTHHHNQGLDFALCARCGVDLIRGGGADDWDELPRGTRVVWRTSRQGTDAAAVAARMARGPVPRRHRPRHRPLDQGRGAGLRPPRPHRMRGRTVLLTLCGKFVLAGIADRFTRAPADDDEGAVIYLPAPRAAVRFRGRSPRAWWSAQSASPPRPSDRREIW